MTLMDRGLQRHRVTFFRKMDEDELRKTEENEPIIERIEMAECETQEEVQAWLKKTAPAFLRGCICARSLLRFSRPKHPTSQ